MRVVILSDSEGSSSTSMAAIKSEEDASYLSMTNGRMLYPLQKPWFLPHAIASINK
jgi:hypothetical protein